MNTPDPTPPVSLAQRTLRILALTLPSVVATLIILVLSFLGGNNGPSTIGAVLILLGVLLFAAGVFIACWKLQRRSWTRLA
jgi:predicted permease